MLYGRIERGKFIKMSITTKDIKNALTPTKLKVYLTRNKEKKFTRASAQSCVIAHYLRDRYSVSSKRVSVGNTSIVTGGVYINTPRWVSKFISKFDRTEKKYVTGKESLSILKDTLA